MLHKTFSGMMACTFVLFTGQALAGECFTTATEGVTVNPCADEKPVFLLPEGEGGLKAEPLSAHKDGFGQPGKYGFYGADQVDKGDKVQRQRGHILLFDIVFGAKCRDKGVTSWQRQRGHILLFDIVFGAETTKCGDKVQRQRGHILLFCRDKGVTSCYLTLCLVMSPYVPSPPH